MPTRALYLLIAMGVTALSSACRAKDGDGSGVSMIQDSMRIVDRGDSAIAAAGRVVIPDEPPPFAGSDTGVPAAMLDDQRMPSRDTVASRQISIPEEPRSVRP